MNDRWSIHLSPPKVTEGDIRAVVSALNSGWAAPAGPDLMQFEYDVASYLHVSHAIALNSGTAALHLALKYLGVGPGDTVLIPTVTFAATAFPVKYLGAEPVFVDIDDSWNIDVEAAAWAIAELRKSGKNVSAAVPVDLYGTPANYPSLVPLLKNEGIRFVEDAAEGLGARSKIGPLGSLGTAGVLSFNGNKIITSSGGGILATDDPDLAEHVRFWSTQSREPLPWYEHKDIGYNYRLSNILAALGRSQFARIDEEVAARRQIRDWYRQELAGVSGVLVQEDPNWGSSNAWLTVVRFSGSEYPMASTRVREFLTEHRIESRPVWKPMHQQPIFADSPIFLTGAADSLYKEGLCLPSGTSLTRSTVQQISNLILQVLSKF